jgi:hypothetical protein
MRWVSWSFAGVLASRPKRQRLLRLPLPAAFAFLFVAFRTTATFEGQAWDYFFLGSFALLTVLIVFTTVRIYELWRSLKGLLRTLATVPILDAYARLPDKAAYIARRVMLHNRKRLSDSIFFHRLLVQIRDEVEKPRWPHRLPDNWQMLLEVPNNPFPVDEHRHLTSHDLRPFFHAAHTLAKAVLPRWETRGLSEAYGSTYEPDIGPKAETKKKKEPTPEETLTDLSEQYLALCVPFFLAPYFIRLRILCMKLTIVTGALLFAATDFSFQPERIVMFFAAGLTAAVIGFLVWLLVGVNRNEMISRISRTTYDRFTPDASFLSGLLTVVLPLLLLSFTQLNGRFRVIFEPILSLFR